jgi:bifunctional non-homologous end joining protein LigD
LNAFEIKDWNCLYKTSMTPDQIVMDFDPGPGVPWKEVVSAALELKGLLDDLGLKSFVKLTGGKGLHVHVPIAPIYNWDQIKSFTQTLAWEMVSNNPRKYVATNSKKIRRGKIFVDYLRNGYGATAVVPYSLRAKPLSAVFTSGLEGATPFKRTAGVHSGESLEENKIQKGGSLEGNAEAQAKDQYSYESASSLIVGI